MPNEKIWYLGKICTRCKQNLEKNISKIYKNSPKSKIGPKMAKLDILDPYFAKPIVYQQYSGILKKWAEKRFFKFPIMANYGQL